MNFFIVSVNPHPQLGLPDGTWNFHFGTTIFKFTASNGQVTIGGQPITFFPGQHGWWQFIYGPLKYYINFSLTDIQVYAFLNGQPVTGTVTKALPDFSKYGTKYNISNDTDLVQPCRFPKSKCRSRTVTEAFPDTNRSST